MISTIRPYKQFVPAEQREEAGFQADVMALEKSGGPRRESLLCSSDNAATRQGHRAGQNPGFFGSNPFAMIFGWFNKMLAAFKELVSARNTPADPPITQQPPPVVDNARVTPVVHDSESAVDEVPEKDAGPPADIWKGFALDKNYRWRPNNNTAHVATIKAAMGRFGQQPNAVFSAVSPRDDGYEVVMRDGFNLHLNHDELGRAAQASRFMGRNDNLLKDANFILAAAIKRKQLESPEPAVRRSYDAALVRSFSLDGEPVPDMLQYLGLAGHVRTARPGELCATDAVGIHDTYPASAVINGIRDVLGRPSPVPEILAGYVLI